MSRSLSEILDGHSFSELEEELADEDIVLDVIILLRTVKPEDVGHGRSALIQAPEDNMDPIVVTGMLHQALRYDDTAHEFD